MIVFLIAYMTVSALGLGVSIATHGKERKPENVWTALLAFFVGQGLVWGIYFTANV